MKKDYTRDYAVEAFRLYALRKRPTYEDALAQICVEAPAAVISKNAELDDIAAVNDMIVLLNRSGKQDIVRAVEIVYFQRPTKHLEKGDVQARVVRASLEIHASTQTIYGWLREARHLFAALRGLRTD